MKSLSLMPIGLMLIGLMLITSSLAANAGESVHSLCVNKQVINTGDTLTTVQDKHYKRLDLNSRRYPVRVCLSSSLFPNFS
ncbi:MAG: hypothetical protein ACRC1W_00950 [Shewanella sp.]